MLRQSLPAFPHELTLGRVVLHTPSPHADADAAHWRWRVGDALRRVSIAPSLPPHAILIVRRLPDPRPGALLADGAQQWGYDARSWLEACAHRAARPAHGPVPASADAVWFADTAEWLACLSWDLHSGAASARWWWHTWLHRRGAVSNSLYDLWEPHAQWLPQTVALLHERYRTGIEPLLLRLSPAQAHHIAALVCAAYDLPTAAPDAIRAAPLSASLPGAARDVIGDLPEQAAALAAVCLALIHAPLTVQQIRRGDWLAPYVSGRAADQDLPDDLSASPPDAALIPAAPAPPVSSAHFEAPAYEAVIPPAEPALDASQQNYEHPYETMPVSKASAPYQSGPLADPPFVEPTMPDAAFTHEAAKFDAPIADMPAIDFPALETLDPAVEVFGVPTQIGGLWYLVNVLDGLGWLESPEDVLDGWQKLEAIARALIDDVPDDPVWEAFAAQRTTEISREVEARWLDQALPAVRGYVAERIDEAAWVAALHDPAMLYLTRTHIDVVFSIEQSRLDLRIAGLDQDPGWVPQLAHIITLHYE